MAFGVVIRYLGKASSNSRNGLLVAQRYQRALFSSDVKESLKDPEKRSFFSKKYMNCMRTLDVDKDNLIKRSDIVQIARDHKNLGISESNYLKLVNAYERISDALGLIGPNALPLGKATENWIRYLETTNLDDNLEKTRFRLMFNNVDSNGDGEISYDEWLKHCKAYGVEAHAMKSFDAMDADNDGKISFEEFTDFLYEFFYTTENKLHSAILYGPVD